MAVTMTERRGRFGLAGRSGASLLRSRRARSDALWGIFFVAPQVLGMVIFVLIPMVWAFVMAFMDWPGLGDRTWIGFQNFQDQFRDDDFRAAINHTAYYTVLAVPGSVIISLLLAMGVNRVRGKMIYRLIFFLPTVTSSVAISMVWMWMLNGDFGLINIYLLDWFAIEAPNWFVDRTWVIPAIALVAIWSGLGFNMVIFLAGLQGIPANYLEAAALDGASKWRQFKDIILPLLSPTTFFVTILSVIASFQVFDMIFVITNGGPGNASRTMVFHIYDLAFVDFTFGASASAAMILFIIILALTGLQFLGQRRWVNYDT